MLNPPEGSRVLIIDGKAPTLPSIEDVEHFFSLLTDEIQLTCVKDGKMDVTYLRSFYLPFIQFLFDIADHAAQEQINLRTWKEKPPEITAVIDYSWAFDKEQIEAYYEKNPPRNGEEEYMKMFLEVFLWYSFFTGRLRYLFEVYAHLLTIFAKKQTNVLSIEEFHKEKDLMTSEEVRTHLQDLVDNELSLYYSAPHQWNGIILIYIAQWLTKVVNPEFRQGNPSYYIYIDKGRPFLVPKAYRKNKPGRKGSTWATGFNQRLIVPNLDELTAEQKGAMWDDLLVNRKIYENTNIDHSVREIIFEAVTQRLEENTVNLDLCGGKGDFILYLSNNDKKVKNILIDISSEAVEYAKKLEIDARVGDAENTLPLEDNAVDSVTINFAVQWLKEQSYGEVLRILKPGGQLIFNVYPHIEEEAERYVQLLLEQGFSNVSYDTIKSEKRTDFIVTAYKPLPNN